MTTINGTRLSETSVAFKFKWWTLVLFLKWTSVLWWLLQKAQGKRQKHQWTSYPSSAWQPQQNHSTQVFKFETLFRQKSSKRLLLQENVCGTVRTRLRSLNHGQLDQADKQLILWSWKHFFEHSMPSKYHRHLQEQEDVSAILHCRFTMSPIQFSTNLSAVLRLFNWSLFPYKLCACVCSVCASLCVWCPAQSTSCHVD